MGTSYTNFIVKADQKRIVGYLKYARRPAYVSPIEGGCCIVCEPLSEDISERAADISKGVGCVVLFVGNDDDDYFQYELWRRGTLIDSHRSPSRRSSRSKRNSIVKPDEWTPDDDKVFGGASESWDDEDNDLQQPETGDAKLLCDAFDRPNAVLKVAKVLSSTQDDDTRYVLSHAYHGDLIVPLGLPSSSYTASYEAIQANLDEHSDWVRC
jgi:hypothetical protein